MRRVLVVPAAGRGTRLGSALPKPLTPVAGRAMIDYILRRHAEFASDAVVIVHPAARAAIQTHVAEAPLRVHLAEQSSPTGMLDAILAAREAVDALAAERVWITWCDQVAISRATTARLAGAERDAHTPAAVFPTVRQSPPYIHFDRDTSGRIVRVRQRREGDTLPDVGESDAGLFSLSAEAYATQLMAYAAREDSRGGGTGERNFLPFLPWLAQRAEVVTFPIDAGEARGINTPEDLAAVTEYLRAVEDAPA
jgi:bifunctional UDP-N-acetylglucosamine pyrophosphorylase/glucosamine-1-phosphate N-acetyltransferase